MAKLSFQEEWMEEESAWKAVVLIPKVGGDYRDIGLVEVVWKLVTVILNHGFTLSIAFHDVLHGFQEDRGTGTASLEAKLLHQLTSTKEEVLYVIFLDLHRTYSSLERDRSLDTLEVYEVVPWDRHVLYAYWDRLKMVDHVGD